MDAAESPEDERAAIVRIGQQVTRLRALVRRRDAHELAIAPGSRTALDDAANPFHSISTMVDHCLSVAEDHLEMAVDYYTRTGRGLRPFAMYTLIRTALESLAYGVWLLQPIDRDERILRSLRYVWAQVGNASDLRALAGRPDEGRLQRQQDRLEGIRNAQPGLVGRSLRKIDTTTKVIEYADTFVSTEHISGLRAWKSCSGIAHGEQVASIGLLERKQVSEGDEHGAVFMVTSSASVVSVMITTALDYFEHLALLDRRWRSLAPGDSVDTDQPSA